MMIATMNNAKSMMWEQILLGAGFRGTLRLCGTGIWYLLYDRASNKVEVGVIAVSKPKEEYLLVRACCNHS